MTGTMIVVHYMRRTRSLYRNAGNPGRVARKIVLSLP